VNVYDLLRYDTLVLSKDAAKALESRLTEKAAVAEGGKSASGAAKRGGK
jgi:hypothetical protein